MLAVPSLAVLIAKGIKYRVAVGPEAVDDLSDRPDNLNVTLRRFRDLNRAAAVDTGSAYADVYRSWPRATRRPSRSWGGRISWASIRIQTAIS